MEDYLPDELDESCIADPPGAEVISMTDLFQIPISVFEPAYYYDRTIYYEECMQMIDEFENEFSEVASDYTKVHIQVRGEKLTEQLHTMIHYLYGNASGTVVYSPPWELVTWNWRNWENVNFYFSNSRDALMFKLKWA